MSFAWYTPTLVQAFGSVKNSDINANLNAIAAAFNAQNGWIATQSGITVPSSGSQAVLVDASNTTADITINLPIAPTVGDPPVTVSLLARSIIPVALRSNGCTQIIASQNIFGITGARPFLYSAGDTITFVYVGGSVGWVYRDFQESVVFNTGLTLFPVSAALFHKLDAIINTQGGAQALSIGSINAAGLFAAVTNINFGSGHNITVGTSGETYNGSAGPFVISVPNVRYLFTCIGTNAFIVTT